MQPLLPTTHGMQHCHSNAICNHSFKKRTELRTQEQPLVAEHRGGTNRVRNDRSRNRRTDDIPFIAGCNHFTGKNTRFRAPASSQKQSPCNIHAAFPMRSATAASRNALNYAHRNNHSLQNTEEEPIASGTTAAATAAQTRYLSSPAAATLHGKTQGFVLRLPPQNFAHATFMQPFQCDLQPQLQETNKTTHAVTTTRCRTQRRNQSRPERPQPQPPHRRGTFHRRLQPLYTEKRKVSCSGFLPKTLPMQHSCRSCSHSNAICIHRFKKRIELRTQEQPLAAEHRGGTNRVRNDRSPTAAQTRYLSSSAATTLHGKTQGFVLRLPPQNFAHATFMQPFQCDLHPQIQETHRTLHTQEQPLVAEHRGGTNRVRNDRSRNRRTDEVPFIAGCNHFTR